MCVWFGEPSHKQTALTIEDDAHGPTRSFCGVMKPLSTCIGHGLDHCKANRPVKCQPSKTRYPVDDSIGRHLEAFVASRMTLVKAVRLSGPHQDCKKVAFSLRWLL